jgi:pimeloyl-ACP methyl ester carboxylesterase
MNAYREQAVLIGSAPQLVGVITQPESARPAARTGVIILGAGLVHHVGPNRMTVRTARRLAQAGLTVLRFDHRGIGDSGPRLDNRPFMQSAVDETREVMDYLARHHAIEDFVVMGICSGAETALRTGFVDERITGVGLINGGGQGYGNAWETYEYVRGEARWYFKRLFNLDSWWRALTGRIRYRRLFTVLVKRIHDRIAPPKNVAEASQQAASDIQKLLARGVKLLWLQSQGDFSQDLFDTMFGKEAAALLDAGSVRVETLAFTDHTLTDHSSQVRVLDLVQDWLSPAPEPMLRQARQETGK